MSVNDLHHWHQETPLDLPKPVDNLVSNTVQWSIRLLQTLRDVADALHLRGKDDEETLKNLEKYVQGAQGRK